MFWCAICQTQFDNNNPASSVFVEGDEYYCCEDCLRRIRG